VLRERPPPKAPQCQDASAELEYFQNSQFNYLASVAALNIHIVIPVHGHETHLSDLIGEILHFADIFKSQNIFVSFGIHTGVSDEVYQHVKGLSGVLKVARVSHHIGIVSKVAEWQYLTILGHDSTEFRLAIVAGGFTCAADLARLVFSTVLTDADMACALEISSSPKLSASAGRLGLSDIPLSLVDLFDTGLKQMPCCHASVFAVSSNIYGGAKLEQVMKDGQTRYPDQQSSISFCSYLYERSPIGPKIMTDTGVRSSPNFDSYFLALPGSGRVPRDSYRTQSIDWKLTDSTADQARKF